MRSGAARGINLESEEIVPFVLELETVLRALEVVMKGQGEVKLPCDEAKVGVTGAEVGTPHSMAKRASSRAQVLCWMATGGHHAGW